MEQLIDKTVLIKQFLHDFETNNLEMLQACMCDDMQSYVTSADGGIFELKGSKAYIDNLRQMNIEAVDFLSVKPTQIFQIDSDNILVMAEIKAKRGDENLHNFSSFLIKFKSNLISEIRMVEALPAKSAEFWAG